MALEHKWARARKRAGLKNRIMHDLRRTAARDFRRAGVSEGEIMKLCGWKTRAMFDRYNIIDEPISPRLWRSGSHLLTAQLRHRNGFPARALPRKFRSSNREG